MTKYKFAKVPPRGEAIEFKNGALSLKPWFTADAAVWTALHSAHDALAEVRLDREESVGPMPRTEAAREFLRKRTPPWLAPTRR